MALCPYLRLLLPAASQQQGDDVQGHSQIHGINLVALRDETVSVRDYQMSYVWKDVAGIARDPRKVENRIYLRGHLLCIIDPQVKV